jgi:acyl-CoA synthetase (AMP-forming)/AMP-acid ligase II
MQISQLPDIWFVDSAGHHQRLVLSKEANRVAALGERLSKSFRPGDAIGLIFRSTPDLVLWWLGAIHAGLRPLIVQFPTAKQSHGYWIASVQNAIGTACLRGVVCDPKVRSRMEGIEVEVVCAPLPEAVPIQEDLEFEDFSIIQMSSGTTGHRKAVEFSSAALSQHAENYNRVLQLSPLSDMIVSWLPLYHDMGYVACFVMPLLLGIPVTMIDPEDWVRNRKLLFQAIERRRGTICYMPNFGFEVMSDIPTPDISSMRLWISCSEPVKPATVRRFLLATGSAEEKFAACYAMAENIFAITQSSGLKTKQINDVEVASCGSSIPGVELKVMDDEIWVRSPTSITSYLGTIPVTDGEGFYPSGDLGQIDNGELYVTGRKRDLLIQAGKKFMLSDIDAVVNSVFPNARGRTAALAAFDTRLGTQRPLVLIESDDWFYQKAGPSISEQVFDSTGLENAEVHFVPPKFLTKTSSGKINRVLTLHHWQQLKERAGASVGDWRATIQKEFDACNFDLPVGEVLDSLSLTILGLILKEVGIELDEARSLRNYVEYKVPKIIASPGREVIRIVSLADSRIFKKLTEQHIKRISRRIGVPITFEHICLPPSPILLSDLVFDDHFADRLPDVAAISTVRRTLDKLRNASAIILDDAAELQLPVKLVYGALSHRLQRTSNADLLGFRWQRYTNQHHLLPVTVVNGSDLPLAGRDRSISMLCSYLNVEAFRIACATAYERYTVDWEMRPLHTLTSGPGLLPLDPNEFADSFADWLNERKDKVRRFERVKGSPRLDLSDLIHFCSHFVDKEALELVLARFDTFCIAGHPSSVSYIPKRLNSLGKKYFYVPSYAPQIMRKADPFDCLLVCGPMGQFRVTVPAVPVVTTSWGPLPINIEDSKLKTLTLRGFPESDSAENWFNPFGPLLGGNSRQELARLEEANSQQAQIGLDRLNSARRRAGLREKKSLFDIDA